MTGGPTTPLLSGRTSWNASANRLTRAREAREAARLPIIDLTRSNPTTAGLPYPMAELSTLLGRAAATSYDPDPRGLLAVGAGIELQ